MPYQIFTDSSADLNEKLRKQYNVDYYRQGIVINQIEKWADVDWKEYTPEELYGWIRNLKNTCKTSLLSIQEISDKTEPYLKKGIDILYIACSDGLTGGRKVFEMYKEELLKNYPGRKIISVNSSRAELALGLLIMDACKKRDEGYTIEQTAQWVEDNKFYYHQVGSIGTLTYLKAAGRVSGAAAFFGNIIGLKPIIAMDIRGTNFAFKKVWGTQKGLEESFEYVKAHMVPGKTTIAYLGKVGYEAEKSAAYLKQRIENELHIPVEEFWIGPIVGISCGPGMYGVWFKGDLGTLDSEAEKK